MKKLITNLTVTQKKITIAVMNIAVIFAGSKIAAMIIYQIILSNIG